MAAPPLPGGIPPPIIPQVDLPKTPKGRPKLPPKSKGLFDIANSLGHSFVIRPIITAFNAIFMFGFNTIVARFPKEAESIAARIVNLYFKQSSGWALFAKTYLEQMTGEDLPDFNTDDLIDKPMSISGQAFAEKIGNAFLHPMLNMILPGTDGWNAFRKEFEKDKTKPITFDRKLSPADGIIGAERFLGVNLQFQIKAWFLHLIGDATSMGNLKSLKDLPNAISWSYGVGWLSWLVMGTPFRMTIAEPLEKMLNSLYRQKDLTVAQAIDARNSGYITDERFWQITREAGWEDEDAVILSDQGTTKLPTGQLKDLFQRNRLTEDQVDAELKISGFSETRRLAILTDWKHDQFDKITDRLAEESIDAYEDRLIDEDTLRDALKAAGWDDIEEGNPIDVQIAVSNLVLAQKAIFSKTELRQLRKVFNKPRSEIYPDLRRHGLPQKEADDVIDLWDVLDKVKEKAPPVVTVRTLAKADIRVLVERGLMEILEAKERLRGLDYSEAAIEQLIKLWTGKKAEVIEELEERIADLTEPEPRILSATELRRLWNQDLVNLTDVYNGFLDLNYAEADALALTREITGASIDQVIHEVPFERPRVTTDKRLLSKGEIKTLFERGLIDPTEAELRMEALRYSEADLQAIMSLWIEPGIVVGPVTTEPTIPPLKVTSKYDLKRLAESGTTGRQEIFDGLVRLGYNDFIGQLFVALWMELSRENVVDLRPSADSESLRNRRLYYPDVYEADIRALFRGKVINRSEAESALASLAYTDIDKALLVDKWELELREEEARQAEIERPTLPPGLFP